jgi:hypothetical protein|tara:strand:- start:265 stop:522 length:258 start_codon:yes stop_codon:yes gene_type:complete
MTNENANLDIIDITLLLRQRRCRESVEDELRKQGIEQQYYCDVDIVNENGQHVLLPFIVNRNTGRLIDVLYDEENNTVQAHIIPQ